MPTSAPAVPESGKENKNFGIELDRDYAERIITDACQMLHITGLSRDKFRIYRTANNHFALQIDVTLEGNGQHMIFLKGLVYNLPDNFGQESLTVERELQQKYVRAELFNMEGHTRSLDREMEKKIAVKFGLDIDNGRLIVNLGSINKATRKKVDDLLLPPTSPVI